MRFGLEYSGRITEFLTNHKLLFCDTYKSVVFALRKMRKLQVGQFPRIALLSSSTSWVSRLYVMKLWVWGKRTAFTFKADFGGYPSAPMHRG